VTVLIPTKENGATAQPAPVLYVEPVQQVTPRALADLMPGSGLNPTFVADLLSAMLTHERCGVHLYRSSATRSNNPILQAKYREFGEQTERHVEILEHLIGAAGGDPNYVSPRARSVEAMNAHLLQSTFLTDGALDPMSAEAAILDGVYLAESICQANWKTMRVLCESMDAGGLRDTFEAAVDEVEVQEDAHLEWPREMRQRLVLLQAKSSTMAAASEKAEELVARVRNWFASDS
jgi:hypothetical protein